MYYYLRVVKVMYLNPAPSEARNAASRVSSQADSGSRAMKHLTRRAPPAVLGRAQDFTGAPRVEAGAGT